MSVKQIWTGKAVDLAARYGEQAPTAAVCSNACRTCLTTNLLGLATAVAGAVGTEPFNWRGGRWYLVPAALERPLDAALGLAVGDVASLVAELLAPRERELDLHAPVLEVEPGRDERQAALGDLRGELVDLAPVQEELAVAVGVGGATDACS